MATALERAKSLKADIDSNIILKCTRKEMQEKLDNLLGGRAYTLKGNKVEYVRDLEILVENVIQKEVCLKILEKGAFNGCFSWGRVRSTEVE